jgi:serine phosphatase RsbU (regulator of sigma subunit)
MVLLGDSIFLAVRAVDTASPRAALAVVPVTTLLAHVPSRLADASLRLYPASVVAHQNNITFSTHTSDSDSTKGGVTLSTGNEVFHPGKRTSLPSLLLRGYTTIPGVWWQDSLWVRSNYLLAAALPPASALSGLTRWARDNPIGFFPIGMLALLAFVCGLIAVFDVSMVFHMGRGIASAIGALRSGAERLEAGDLTHRIEVAGDDDLWDVAAAFNTAAAGLERGARDRAERNRLESELAVARQIQARLLPEAPPDVPGLELAGHSESAREVGGDYYDHLDLGDGRALLVIADVSGKGVPAALLMSGFRASLLSQDLPRIEVTELVQRLNESVVRSVRPGRFVTAFVAFVDGASGRIEYVNAGHNPPVLVRAAGAEPVTLTDGGPLLGPFPGVRFERGESALAPGDLLVLYTDGVTEGADATGAMWGEERLVTTLRARASERCATIVRAVASDVRAFEGATGPADDITLLAARRISTA